MNRIESFQKFLATQSTQVPLIDFLVNLVLVAMLSSIMAKVYIRYGRALSNRKLFANQFLLLSCTTMLIITIVKSSLALSLGLVGALSIVRFRSAIKEPEELIYLFLNIGIGLGMGANQRLITLIGFVLMMGMVVLRERRQLSHVAQNIVLTISQKGTERISLDQAIQILKGYCSQLDLKRFDETQEGMEASFLVEYEGFEKLTEGKSALQRLCPSLRISFADYGGML